MKTSYCALALLTLFSLNAKQPAKSTKPKTPAPIVPPKRILKTHKDIEEFTKEEVSKKTLRAFAKAGKKVPTTMSIERRIETLLSTFDALEAKYEEKIKLSDKYREWERKLVDKVIDDKTTYDLENDQIIKMLNMRADFNNFLQQAIAIVKKQESRR